ncbi:MAG: sugar transferase [Bacteroidales bacterium]|nr:sugar transferase [Bacteroidales bacterium]
MLKRIFDIAVSFVFICTLFLPLYIIIGIAVKFTSQGPVLFRQQRHGKDGQVFTCLKFRTMKMNSEADTLQATDNDRRVTSIGHFLRRTSLDELPQFINVLKGDMSLIGPRPHMLYHTQMYSSLIPDYMQRLSVKPGITGLAQILGCRGETPDVADMARRIRLDLWYIDHRSFRLDLYIFFRTLRDFMRIGR